jgi:hypothetical protein
MRYQTEEKLQAWRALAILPGRGERLLYVGRSTSHVREGYAAALENVLDAEERRQVETIELQCWQGAADRGSWVQKAVLPMPAARPGRHVLPFRKPAKTPGRAKKASQPKNARKRLATTA